MNNNINFAGKRATSQKIVRLDVRNGHLSQYCGSGNPRNEFDYAEGKLLGISVRTHETPAGEVNFVDLHFENKEQKFTISCIACSCVTADLIARLANIQNPDSLVRIEVWPKGSFTNCAVYENGERLPYLNLPKAVKVQNGLKMVVDSSDRDTAVLKLIEEINTRCGYVQ